MNKENKPLYDYFKENDPAFWETIGKDFESPVIFLNEIIRHYQWIYYQGDLDELDLGSHINKYYKEAFIEVLARNPSIRDQFFNFLLNSFKIAYDYEKNAWYRKIVINILINNKNKYMYDYLAMYALIASSYNVLRWMLVHDYNCDEKIGIPKEEFIKLFDGISNQEFYNELKNIVKNQRNNSIKNIYLK